MTPRQIFSWGRWAPPPWTKTFQIQLRQHAFEDVKAVIAAIHALPTYVDQQRYKSPYRVFEEWERALGFEIHEAVESRAVVCLPEIRKGHYDSEGRFVSQKSEQCSFEEAESRRQQLIQEIFA